MLQYLQCCSHISVAGGGVRRTRGCSSVPVIITTGPRADQREGQPHTRQPSSPRYLLLQKLRERQLWRGHLAAPREVRGAVGGQVARPQLLAIVPASVTSARTAAILALGLRVRPTALV